MDSDFKHGGRSISDNSLIAGTFLICLSMLAFEISTVRSINFAIGPSHIFIAISLAMLGLTAAGSVLSQINLTSSARRRRMILGTLCAAIALLIVLAHMALAAAKDDLNAIVRAAGIEGQLGGVVGTLLVHGAPFALKMGAILSLPYFLFGALLSYLFATAPPRDYARLYAADLVGAAVGCAAIVVVMETTGYAVSVTVPAIMALLAGTVFLWRAGPLIAATPAVAALALAALTQTAGYVGKVEPRSDANFLVRDYSVTERMVERWTGWNSFTRVAALEAEDKPGQGAVLALSNGDGMAFLKPYTPQGGPSHPHPPAIPALIAGTPDSALVVFAGSGADMMTLRDHGATRLVGLELNQRLIDAGLALPDYRLQEFLALEGVDLEIEDARTFLERDTDRYDMVLVSWSGATAVYHLGALGGTTQYIFTYEGLEAILDRLDDDGVAVILQVNKFDMLDGVRRYMADRGLPDPARAAIVLFKPGTQNAWDSNWDDNPLLIKPSGWSEDEVEAVLARASVEGFEAAYAPGRPSPLEYEAYARLMTSEDPASVVRDLSADAVKRFGAASDDRPFVMDHFAPGRILTAGFWLPDPSEGSDISDFSLLIRVWIALVLSVMALALAVGPLLLSRKRVVSRRRASVYLGYFTLLGAGFMLIEIGLVQRVGILFGNPGLAIAVVLGLVILSTGVGSIVSERVVARGVGIRAIAVLVAGYGVAAGLIAPTLIDWVLGAGPAAKLAVTALLIVPGGILMGQLFPQGLALAGAEDKRLVPWAWAINGAMSASMACVAPILAQMTGFQSLFLFGAALYALILLLPIGQPAARGRDLSAIVGRAEPGGA